MTKGFLHDPEGESAGGESKRVHALSVLLHSQKNDALNISTVEQKMHSLLVTEIVKRVRQRISEGDCPTIPAESVETLEQAVEELAAMIDRIDVSDLPRPVSTPSPAINQELAEALIEVGSMCEALHTQWCEDLSLPPYQPALDAIAKGKEALEKHAAAVKRSQI